MESVVWGFVLYSLCIIILYYLSSLRNKDSVTEGFRLNTVVPSLSSDFICSAIKKQIDSSKSVLASHIEDDAVSSASQTANAIVLLNTSFKAHKCDQYA